MLFNGLLTAVFHLQGHAFAASIHPTSFTLSPFEMHNLNFFSQRRKWNQATMKTDHWFSLFARQSNKIIFPIVKQRSYSDCSVGRKWSRLCKAPTIRENCRSRALNFPPSELHRFVWPSFWFAVATHPFAIVASGKFLPNGPSVTLHVNRCRHSNNNNGEWVESLNSSIYCIWGEQQRQYPSLQF